MRVKCFCFAVLLLCCSWSQGSEIADYPYLKTLVRQAGEGKTGSIRLDRELQLREESGMRLFAPDGSEVPLGKAQPILKKVSEKILLPIELKASLADTGDFSLSFTLENPDRKEIAGIAVRTNDRNFDKLVQIEASEDGENYRVLVDRAPFYDYSGRLDLSKREFTFPAVKSPFFRVRVMNYPDKEPLPALETDGGIYPRGNEERQLRRRFKVDRIDGLQQAEEVREREVLEAVVLQQVERVEEKERTVVNIQTELIRIDRIELTVEGKSTYLRKISFYGSHDKEKYVFIGSGDVCRLFESEPERKWITFSDFQGGVRYPFYQLVIHNVGRPKLPELNISLYAPAREMLFESTSNSLALVYGGKSGTLRLPHSAEGDIVAYLPGPEQPNPSYSETKINYLRWILAFFVGGLLIVLFALLWRGYKMIRSGNFD